MMTKGCSAELGEQNGNDYKLLMNWFNFILFIPLFDGFSAYVSLG